MVAAGVLLIAVAVYCISTEVTAMDVGSGRVRREVRVGGFVIWRGASAATLISECAGVGTDSAKGWAAIRERSWWSSGRVNLRLGGALVAGEQLAQAMELKAIGPREQAIMMRRYLELLGQQAVPVVLIRENGVSLVDSNGATVAEVVTPSTEAR